MYIVYEGPDRVGKTTTRKLVEKQRDGKDIVIDRFIGSNIVYGIVGLRYTLEEFQCMYVDDARFAKMFNAVLIYLYAPMKTILERMEKDGHEEIGEEKLKMSLEQYDKYYKRCGYEHKIKIDTSKYNQEKVVEKILKFLKNVERKQRHTN